MKSKITIILLTHIDLDLECHLTDLPKQLPVAEMVVSELVAMLMWAELLVRDLCSSPLEWHLLLI